MVIAFVDHAIDQRLAGQHDLAAQRVAEQLSAALPHKILATRASQIRLPPVDVVDCWVVDCWVVDCWVVDCWVVDCWVVEQPGFHLPQSVENVRLSYSGAAQAARYRGTGRLTPFGPQATCPAVVAHWRVAAANAVAAVAARWAVFHSLNFRDGSGVAIMS